MTDRQGGKLSTYWTPQKPSPLKDRPYQDVVEEAIQEAMKEGKFNNLPGKGKPLNLDSEHPWEQRDWMSNHILSNAKVVPDWVYMGEEIERGYAWLRASAADHPERVERIAELNRLVDRYNLKVPAGFMQKPRWVE